MSLKQARESIKINILENPSIISFEIPTYITDELTGNTIEDPSGDTTYKKERARLSHESSGVNSNEVTPAGLGTSYTLFLLSDYKSDIKENITITANSKKYTTGAVDTLRSFGGVIGYQTPLTEVK